MNSFRMPAMQRIGLCAASEDGQLVGRFEEVAIRSVFQPIYDLRQCCLAGVEGLMRCCNGQGEPISPLAFLGRAGRSEEECVFLDRLCRYLHLGNRQQYAPEVPWLFLNVSAHTVIAGRRYGSYFSDLLRHFDVAPQRVVVEILEDALLDEAKLAAAAEYYRELGCIIAIDDFGIGNSNFGRLLEISPDIVKLDRSLLVRAGNDARTERLLPKLVEMLHDSGCQVVIEGVESERDAWIAQQSGADMVQGYYFAMPGLPVAPSAPALARIQSLRQGGTERTQCGERGLGVPVELVK